MADAPNIPDEAEVRARWGNFAWTDENQKKANEILARYPKGREQSCSIRSSIWRSVRSVRRRRRKAGCRFR